ncbi:maleylpyruvate isomerase family mycothiol-dependent enzyme [Propioniciclava soli]|uniref:Maleylpyruvate isomerase family mycothiol-dependent enzyme n=1 Tax=Propioniciclava soli TaxID=2775081 RepID=A0ABZ3C8A4_9ACTN
MIDHASVLADESARFAAVVAESDPDSPVPTCPGWTVDDLLWHLTDVHGFWTRILTTGAQSDADVEAAEAAGPARPEDRAALLDLFAAETNALAEALAGRADDEPAWFWLGSDQSVGATRRMQAFEATMHRVDAEVAAGLDPTRIGVEVALGAIRHAFDVMWAWWGTLPGFTFTPVAKPVALVATDADATLVVQGGRWRGTGESGKEYDEPGVLLMAERDAAAPAASATGTAEQLALWLWGRGPEPATEGDEASLTALRQVQEAGMQ